LETKHLYYAESSRNPQAKFQDSLALPFEQVLPEGVIQTVLEEQGVNHAVHANCSGVGMDVSSPRFGQSLSNAVNRVIAWLAAAGEEVPADTGAYSKALLPLSVLKPLFKRTAEALQAEVKPEQRWCGRR